MKKLLNITILFLTICLSSVFSRGEIVKFWNHIDIVHVGQSDRGSEVMTVGYHFTTLEAARFNFGGFGLGVSSIFGQDFQDDHSVVVFFPVSVRLFSDEQWKGGLFFNVSYVRNLTYKYDVALFGFSVGW